MSEKFGSSLYIDLLLEYETFGQRGIYMVIVDMKGKVTVVGVALTIIGLCGVVLSGEEEDGFEAFVRLHGKHYSTEEFTKRQKIFRRNHLYVQEFNAQSQEVKLTLNWLADLSDEEYRELLFDPSDSLSLSTPSQFLSLSSLPSAIDWSHLGAVTPIKDQKSCGACYAFAATGALEGAYFLNTTHLESFSEQELVDCSKTYGNHGCHGGKIESAFRYIRMHGIMQESQYPYVKYDHDCLAVDSTSKVFLRDIIVVPKYDQMQLKAAVAKQPVAIALQADQKLFQLYHSGILGNECGSRLSHAALLIGYGKSSEGVDYWIVKNSWGRGWGESGFVRILRTDTGKDAGPCGITLDAYYPVI